MARRESTRQVTGRGTVFTFLHYPFLKRRGNPKTTSLGFYFFAAPEPGRHLAGAPQCEPAKCRVVSLRATVVSSAHHRSRGEYSTPQWPAGRVLDAQKRAHLPLPIIKKKGEPKNHKSRFSLFCSPGAWSTPGWGPPVGPSQVSSSLPAGYCGVECSPLVTW